MADHDILAARVARLEKEIADLREKLRDLAQALAVDIAVRAERYQRSVEQREDVKTEIKDLRERAEKARDGGPAQLPKELLPYVQTGTLGWLVLKYLGIIP